MGNSCVVSIDGVDHLVPRGGSLTLGSGDSADVQVDDQRVQGIHARIEDVDDDFLFVDDSSDGSFLSDTGRSIQGGSYLLPGGTTVVCLAAEDGPRLIIGVSRAPTSPGSSSLSGPPRPLMPPLPTPSIPPPAPLPPQEPLLPQEPVEPAPPPPGGEHSFVPPGATAPPFASPGAVDDDTHRTPDDGPGPLTVPATTAPPPPPSSTTGPGPPLPPSSSPPPPPPPSTPSASPPPPPPSTVPPPPPPPSSGPATATTITPPPPAPQAQPGPTSPPDGIGTTPGAPPYAGPVGTGTSRPWWKQPAVLAVLLVLALVAAGVTYVAVQNGGTTSAQDIEVGKCYEEPSGEFTRLQEQDCAGVHDLEIIQIVRMPPGPFPTQAEFQDQVGESCGPEFDTVNWEALPPDADGGWFEPNRAGWEIGDHDLACYVYSDTGLVGPVLGLEG